jgi:ribonuclease T1
MTSGAPISFLLLWFVALLANAGFGCGIAGAAELILPIQAITTDTATPAPSTSTRDGMTGSAQGSLSPMLPQAPPKAHDVLKAIQDRGGDPLPGYAGDRIFQNRERRLPRGSYREYDVNPKRRGRNRGAERIVIEQQTGKAYYTDDHYRTFVPMN